MTSRMRMSTRSAVKTAVRNVTRRLGYDLVPFGDSFRDLQRRALATVPHVLDVGANTGQYADLLRSLGYNGTITSYEPGSAAFGVLSRRAAGEPLWDVRQLALSSEPGKFTLHLAGNSVSSSLLDIRAEHVDAAPASRTVTTEVVCADTLDAQLASLPASDSGWWLKIDTQGFEMQVLRGAEAVLRRLAWIQCELSLADLYAEQADWLVLAGWLRERAFRLAHIEPGFQQPGSGCLLQVDGLFRRV